MKGRALLSESVVGQARAALDAHRGRPKPATIGFIAGQLRSLDRDADAERIEDLLMTRLGTRDIVHVIFTLSGNDPTAPLAAHAAGRKLITDRRLIGLRVSDHQAFIQAVFDHIHAQTLASAAVA